MSETKLLVCPVSGTKGKAVKVVTLQSLIKPEYQHRVTEGPYRYCAAQGCDVVYFAEDGSHVFTMGELKVLVGVKETGAPRPICYCFNHTVEEVFDEIRWTGKSTVPDDIKSRLNDEGCDCEHTNPQGSCCLGVVLSFVKDGVKRFATGVTDASAETFEDCCQPGPPIAASPESCCAVPQPVQDDCCAPKGSPSVPAEVKLPDGPDAPSGKGCCK
jgi:hypothetical protein